MNKPFDVISIGVIVQDIIFTGIPADAMSRDTSVAKQALLTSGGDAANEAVTLGRLGSKAALLVKIGEDPIGKSIYSTLENEPVDRSLMIHDDKAEMLMAAVLIQPDGNRSFIVKKGNIHMYLHPEEITDEILSQARAVTVGSLFCLPGLDGPGIADVLKRAKALGLITVCDMTYDLNGLGPRAMDIVYPYIDYMAPSLEEALYTTGCSDPDQIADFYLSMGVKTVVLKLGGDGCFVKNAETRFFCDPYCITPIDTTGCGDNFLGAFTHAMLKGWSLENCADFACAAGALNATGIGAHHTIKNEQHVLDFMSHTPKRTILR